MESDAAWNWFDFLKRLPSLFFGLFLVAFGLVANLHSNLGMNPWGVLNVGIAKVTTLTIGQTSQLIGLVVIIVGWLLGFAPGFGTLANMYFIGSARWLLVSSYLSLFYSSIYSVIPTL